ncbi:MAG: hypothetical protein U9O24_01310 [Campylobacterota bacterium]|nr:hypothetical protein [Campylobacterota bacterium]
MNIKKILLILTLLLTQALFSASSEQIEQYLTLSNADEELLELESQFSQMQNRFLNSKADTSEEKKMYDIQMLTIRFKEYLAKNLSENEMDDVLQSYKNVIFLQFISATSIEKKNNNEEIKAYVKTFENNASSSVRLSTVEKINEKFNNKESITLHYDKLIKPLMQAAPGGEKLDNKYIEKSREAYVKSTLKKTKEFTLFATKEFTQEELDKLLKIAQTPAIEHEIRAVYGAMAFALKDFFLTLASGYDISKHQR